MRQPAARLSNIQKFFITLTVILLAVIFGYRYFLEKTRKVELYDAMHGQISSVRVSISKLEYLLDMYVVARRFENTTVDLIKGDVRAIDDSIFGVIENRSYRKVLKENKPLADGMDSISEDWLTIKNEIKRLNAAMSQDELILTHNAVDMNAIVVTEKAERLLTLIADDRKKAFYDAKGFVLRSAIVFVLVSLAAALAYYRKVIRPLDLASRTAEGFARGDLTARVRERQGGSVGLFTAGFNSMLESVAQAYLKKQEENRDIRATIERKTSQIKSIESLMDFAGRTLSQAEFFNAAVREAVCNGADAAAIYSIDGNTLKLMTSNGFDPAFAGETGVIGFSEIGGLEKETGPRIFSAQAAYPSGRYWSILKSQGFSALVCVPMEYNDEVTGFLYAAFRDEGPAFAEGADVFMEALGSCVAVSNGHLGLFLDELSSRKFFERVLNQMPSGIAVFERGGRCRFMNGSLRLFLGVDQRFDADNGYNLFEDAFLSSQSLLASVRKTFDGHPYEFRGIYDPAVNARFGFSGRVRRVRMRSLPLYDAGGEITCIMIVYDDLNENEPGAGCTGPEK